ncbi:hypothetical protein FQA39_LY13254 [Lamprigera yunnana]|nr:hypothetical protein FQA39_LY13254 [Lamprigera yunnana]
MSKREREEVKRDIFGKGMIVITSPEQKKREERTKDGDRSIKRQKKEMDNMDDIRQEIKFVRKEMEEKEKKWGVERENLMKGIERYEVEETMESACFCNRLQKQEKSTEDRVCSIGNVKSALTQLPSVKFTFIGRINRNSE